MTGISPESAAILRAHIAQDIGRGDDEGGGVMSALHCAALATHADRIEASHPLSARACRVLATNIARAATLAALDTLAGSSDWKIRAQARFARMDLTTAEQADAREAGDGGFYRTRARSYVTSIAARPSRGWQLDGAP